MNDLKDDNENGIPDVIEDALDEAKDIKKRFGVKTILVTMLVGLIVAGYGIVGYLYMDLKDNYIQLQQQYDWQQTETEIEVNAQLIKERQRLLEDLKKEAEDLQADLENKRKHRVTVKNDITSKPYARRNENEVNKKSTADLKRDFSELGFPTKPRTE